MKKDLQDQLALLKQQQEQISQMTIERDGARADLRKLKAAMKEANTGAGKRVPFGDVLNIVGGSSSTVETRSKRAQMTEQGHGDI